MLADFRLALRQLSKTPGFTAVVVLSLSIGIGAATAIFSVLNAVALRALPVDAPHELRIVSWTGLNPKLANYTGNERTTTAGGFTVGSSFPFPVYQALQEQAAGTASIFAFFPMNRVNVSAKGEANTISGMMVSGNFFAEYGTRVFLGRPLLPEDNRPGTAPAAVITYGMWERRLGLDPHVIGQTISINQHAFTIVGVLPRKYSGPLPGDMAEIYVSFAAQPLLASNRPLDALNHWWVQMIMRVPHGTDATQIQSILEPTFRRMIENDRGRIQHPGILLENGAQGAGPTMRARFAKPMIALLVGVGILMIVACANVAGLLLERSAARRHEFAVRIALGASRWRLVRQSLAESLLIALASSAVGLLFANWGKHALLQSFGNLPDNFRVDHSTDMTVALFTLGVSLLTALTFGLLPALRSSRADPQSCLKVSAAMSAPRQWLGRALVALQIGVSVLLFMGAGMLLRTFINLARIDPGFDSENVLVFRVDPSQAGIKGAAIGRFLSEANRALETIPGVQSVARTSLILVSDESSTNTIVLPNQSSRPNETAEISQIVAGEGFFRTLGIPVMLGREFLPSDTAESQLVAVVNETFVRKFFAGKNPIGLPLRLTSEPGRTFTIVGVSRDAKHTSIRTTIPPVVCFCSEQLDYGASKFIVRATIPPALLIGFVRRAISSLNPNVPLSAIRTQKQLVRQSVAIDRLFAFLGSGLAGLAILLACIGLYGLIAYNVAARTREFGIRAALGATRINIVWPIMREALLLAAVGLTLGIPGALGIALLIRNQLYGIGPADPLTLVAGTALLLLVTALAAWLPARRAMLADPCVSLRSE